MTVRQERQIARRIKAAAYSDQNSRNDFDFEFN